MRTLRAGLSTLAAPGGDERGFVLPLALIVLIVLASLTGALLAVGSTESQVSSNHLRGTQAYFLAEAGLEDALNTLRDSAVTITSAPATLTSLPGLSGASPTLAAFGSYTVEYQRLGGSTVRVVSTGRTASGSATKTLTAVFSNAFAIDAAIVAGTNFSIGGNAVVNGTCGNVHSNGDLSVSGSPSVGGSLTATGAYVDTGHAAIGGTAGGGQPAKAVPTIIPSSFLASAKTTVPANQIFQLKSNGQVLDGYDSMVQTVASGATYRGWRYTAGTPATWAVIGDTGYDGTYYVEGNATISGNPGTASTPWAASVIATGSILVSGSPEMNTHLPDTLFVSGLDVQISGSPTLGFNGLVAAHEQVSISGNMTLNGFIVAEGASSTSGTVTQNAFGGSPTITFTCGAITPPGLAGTLTVVSWGI